VIIVQGGVSGFGHPQVAGKDVKGGGVVDDFKILSKIQGGGQALGLFDSFCVCIIVVKLLNFVYQLTWIKNRNHHNN